MQTSNSILTSTSIKQGIPSIFAILSGHYSVEGPFCWFSARSCREKLTSGILGHRRESCGLFSSMVLATIQIIDFGTRLNGHMLLGSIGVCSWIRASIIMCSSLLFFFILATAPQTAVEFWAALFRALHIPRDLLACRSQHHQLGGLRLQGASCQDQSSGVAERNWVRSANTERRPSSKH